MNYQFISPIFKAVKHWYIPLISGILHILVGILVLNSPTESLVALGILFGASFVFSGIIEIIFAITNKDQLYNWLKTLIFGVLTTVLGFLLIINNDLSVFTIALFVGFTILFRAFATISFSLDLLRYGSRGWKWLLILGLLGVIVSILLIIYPKIAGLSLVYLIGLGFLFAGAFRIYFSLLIRKLHKHSKGVARRFKERIEQVQDDLDEYFSE